MSLAEQLIPGTLEFMIHRLVEKHIDLSIFEQQEEDMRDNDTPPDKVKGKWEKQLEKLKNQVERIQAWLKENDAKIGKN